MSDRILFEELVPGGAMWSHVLRRGSALRLTDIEGGANAGMMLYNWENVSERYNMPDTLKAQHIARLTKGNVLYTDMGRILCSITHDTVGWHDPIGGCSNEHTITARYGVRRYQEHRNACYKNGRDCFLIELAKYDMGERDFIPNINWFSKVQVDDDGVMHFIPQFAAGAIVQLRAEMDTLVIMNTCPHPLDMAEVYAPKPVGVTCLRVPPAGFNDPCRNSRPENYRGFILTERYMGAKAAL